MVMSKRTKVIFSSQEGSRVLAGDEDAARFNDEDSRMSGKALPTLVGEGWRIVSMSRANKTATLLLERDE